MEFSKQLIVVLIAFCMLGIIASYTLAFDGKSTNDTVTVALITTIMGSCVSYLIYTYKLKDSRNRHKVDVNGIPFVDWNNNGIPDEEEEFNEKEE